MRITFLFPGYLLFLLLVPLTIWLGWLGRRAMSKSRLWSSLVLRSLIIVFLVSSLAGTQLRLASETLTTVFILDVSDSIPAAERDRGEEFIREAIKNMPPNSQAAIILFGRDALVERLPSESTDFSDLSSIPVTIRTDIAGALQLAQAILPAEGAKRLVLLSDGRENLESALEQAELAASYGVELLFVPLGYTQGEAEVLIDSLQAPADVRQGEDFNLDVLVVSSASMYASLRFYEDGQLVATREVSLVQGENRFRIPVEAAAPSDPQSSGFRRFRVQILPAADTRLQNNEASAFTVVHGPPRVLIIEANPEEGENLARSLTGAEMTVTRLPPSQLPTSLPELAGYDAIILVNIPAGDLPEGSMQVLPVFVSDLGKGLIMVGGQNSFGAGGYLRTPLEKALPVDMDVKDKDLRANVALVLVVDKSGSMGRCHCDNPDLNQTYTRTEVGQPKVDIAKAAIMRAASALSSEDFLGVVAFDAAAHWVLRLAQLLDPASIEQSIGGFQAAGNTNLEAGVKAAYEALQSVEARRKHIILMTDGWVREGDLTALAQNMNAEGITLSIVAAGEGSAKYLQQLASFGGGAYYPATDLMNVPEIFLKETIKSVGQYIIEETVFPLPNLPGPALNGLDLTALPAILGYNGSTAKGAARVDLVSPRGDPLLATWQYGLGRAAVWTSDLKAQWAGEWLDWEGFGRFAAQLIGWVLPAPKIEGLNASAGLNDGQAEINLEAVNQAGYPMNFLQAQATLIYPDLSTEQLTLTQIGPGSYQATSEVTQPGTYLVRLGVNDGDRSMGQLTMGLVVPYSPEYKSTGIEINLLGELARLTGGGELGNAVSAFERHDNLQFSESAQEIWPTLLLLAALLFPVDVGLRRLLVTGTEWRKAKEWLQERLTWRRQRVSAPPRVLGQLFKARDRARQGMAGPERPPGDLQEIGKPRLPTELSQKTPEIKTPLAQAPTEKKSPESEATPAMDSLARLREAKKRAKR